MMLRDINSIDELGSSNSHTALHFEEEPRSQARQPSSSPNSAAYNRSKSGPSKGGTHSISDSSDEDDEGHSDGDSDGRGHGHARNTANSDSGSTSHHRHSPDCDADEHGHAHNSHDHAHTSDTHAHAHTERHNHSHADSSHDHSHVNAGDMHGHTHGEDAHGHIHDDGDAHGHSHGEHDDNMYAVYIHVVGDVVGSLGVISSGLLNHYMRTPHNYLIDPMITCLVATILMMASFPVVKRTSRVLMQATPKTIDMEGIKGRLLDIAGLESIQTFNIWLLCIHQVVEYCNALEYGRLCTTLDCQ
ncbi:hypothetical protein SARC_12012 [Sphaeroforma arctica JP610]|uniref:Cation efflux protein transmembrane domain-containing protein n=1 Tax=Sphaeroforma arctica JP610 TaxID=667725 RepID=A0A0L0FFD5_9EUKA|nr:hypothetical protein SARC_12012 [Sphaeroforma arctica JP610]KNC75465.1 hypothetical protein SARC_12012 [Sphaeroforma arctica JP610]|eukprot:XP_014149367.1 hypothetical protein SARC_12012 [Sphaeroforma arctica JP610]